MDEIASLDIFIIRIDVMEIRGLLIHFVFALIGPCMGRSSLCGMIPLLWKGYKLVTKRSIYLYIHKTDPTGARLIKVFRFACTFHDIREGACHDHLHPE